MKKKLTRISITDEERKLVNNNIKIIFDVVNKDKKFKNCSKDIVDELYAQGYIEVCNRIHNYKETDNLYSFIKNILKYSLYNYYIRNILEYKPVYTGNTLSDEELDNKSVYDEIHKEDIQEWKEEIKLWKLFRAEWDKQYTIPCDIKKPQKPQKQSYSTQKRMIKVEIVDDLLEGNDYENNIIKEDKIYNIRKAIGKLNPIKRKYIEEVYYKDVNPHIVVNNINQALKELQAKIEPKIEVSNVLNMSRESLLNINDFTDDIGKYCYEKVINTNISVSAVFKKIRARTPYFFNNEIIRELKGNINSTI